MTLEQKEINYPDNALFGLSHKLALELFGHLRVEELVESPLDGQRSLPVPLLHLVAELVPVVELLDFVKVGLISSVSEGRQRGDAVRIPNVAALARM